jgi:nucleotide-binding universal stress UspA family protein
LKLAALVAGPDSGKVVPVNILGFGADQSEVEEHRELATEAEKIALANGAEASALVRIDASPTAGVLHTVVEGGGTSLLIGWKGYANARENFFGGVIDAILQASPVPVMVCRPGEQTDIERVVLSVTRGDLAPGGLPGLAIAARVAERISRQAEVPLCVVTEDADHALPAVLEDSRRVTFELDERKPPIALRERSQPGDVIITGAPPSRAGLGQNASRLARAVPDRTLIAVVPRQAD